MSKSLRFFGFIVVFIAVITAGSTTLADTALSSTFTYQGFLSLGGSAVTSPACDLEFGLFSTTTGGTPLGGSTIERTVSVSGGVFIAQLDFGVLVFDGQDRYLEIGVLCPTNGGAGPYTLLSPRSPITPTPYAVHSVNANELVALRVQYNLTSPNLIGGFSGNSVGPTVVGATIGGGGTNTIGTPNVINGNYATIGGGDTNTAGGNGSVIAGGGENVSGSLYSTVGGGNQNSAIGQFSVVSGGFQNLAGVGEWSTVPGGRANTASGNYSYAAGRRAKAVNDGSFVWGDSTDADINSTTANQFIVRASGGYIFYTDAGLTTGVTLANGAGAWGTVSDRNVKDNFVTVDPRIVLEDVLSMPITSWNYIAQGDSIRHIGPMAQDFYAAFGVGEDEKHISTVDADGVALAAIQGLYQVVQDKDIQIASLQAENATLKTRLDDLDQRLAALESLALPSQAGLSLPVMLLALLIAGSIGFAGRRFLRQDV